MLRSRSSFVIAIIIALIATAAFAQEGRITGRVARSDGSGIGGVIVQVSGMSKAAVSDSNGAFTIDGVPAGTHTLRFEAGDHSAEESVTVTAGQAARVDKQVDWRMAIAETITVYSASRRAERVVEAPAAVTVVPEEEVEAVAPSGQAPRLVENAPGVDYTQSGLYDSNFNARGFNSSLNRRILTLVDGRDPAIAFLGAQEWAALSFPLDEMAAVELIRGPGSALYGANAFSGVLNMTTKRPRDTQGGRLLLSGGDLDTKRADLRHSGGISDNWFYRVVGGYQNSGDYSRSRTAASGVEYLRRCAATGQEDCLPGEISPLVLNEVNVAFGGLRLDGHFGDTSLLTVEGGFSTIEGPVFQTGIGRVQVTDVERPWFRANYNRPHLNILGYYDARKAENQVALASGARLFEDSYNLHGEVMTDWDFMQGKTRFVGGVAWNQQDVDTANPQGVQTLMSQAKSEEQQSVFGQVDFNVTDKLKFVGAARWDDSTLHEAQFSPKGAIVFQVNPNHTVRYGYNEAFQRPNYSELFLRAPAGAPVNLAGAAQLNPAAAPLAPVLQQLGFGSMAILALGNSALDVEKVRSHELGYSGIFGGRLYMTVDLYQSNMKDFVTDLLPGVNPAFPRYEAPATLPANIRGGIESFLAAALGPRRVGLTTVNGAPALVLSYANAGEVDTQGAEVAFNYYITNNWVADFNYSWFDFDVKTQAVGDKLLPNAPDTKFNAGVSYRSVKFDARLAYRWVDGFRWAAGVFVGNVPQYDVLNLAANYRISERFSIGADISNLLDDEHWEAFGGDLLSRRALASFTVRW